MGDIFQTNEIQIGFIITFHGQSHRLSPATHPQQSPTTSTTFSEVREQTDGAQVLKSLDPTQLLRLSMNPHK